MTRTLILTVLVSLLATAITLAMLTTDTDASGPKRCDTHHPHECAKLRHRNHRLEAAVEWQKHDKAEQAAEFLERMRGAQPFAYAAQLAYLSCVAFTFMGNPDCRPPSEMLRAGRCESGLQVDDPNPTSTASNWMQYLDDTWWRSPGGRLGFHKLDVLAVAIVTEAKARSGWHEWRASIACHGMT